MSSLDIHYVEGLGNVTVYKYGNLCTVIPDPVKQEIEYMTRKELYNLLEKKGLLEKEENHFLVISLVGEDKMVKEIVNEVFQKFFKPGFKGRIDSKSSERAEIYDIYEKKTRKKLADFVLYQKQERNFMIITIYFPDNVLTLGYILPGSKYMYMHIDDFERAINKFIDEIYS